MRRYPTPSMLILVFLLPLAARAVWKSEGPFLAVVNDIAVDSSKPDIIYLATSAGGVWRSDDGGLTWNLSGTKMTSRSVRWVEVDPTNPATLWAGVKKAGGPGLWRSLDRGESWEVVQVDPYSKALDQHLAFAPSQPEIIFVPVTNLHFRSADGGDSWRSFRVPGQDAYSFAVHPNDHQIVFAGGRGSELSFSRSEDGGKSWQQTGYGLPEKSIRSLLIDAANPSTLYAAVGFGDLFKSTDMGDTWVELDLGLTGTENLFSLTQDPTDPKVLWAATERALRRSADAGSMWVDSDHGLGRYLCKAVAFHPARPGTMYAGTAGTGFYRSSNHGTDWTLSSQGLAAGWTEKLWVGTGGGVLFAQMSVGLFRRDASGTWTEIQRPFSKGKAAELNGILFDRSKPSRIHAFWLSQNWRSEDGGRSWKERELKGPSLKDMMKGRLDTPQFRSLVQNPSDPRTFYAGSWSNRTPGTAVFKTTDDGKTWKPSGQGVPNEEVAMLQSEAPGTIFAVVRKHGVYRSTNGGGSWSKTSSGLPDAEIRELAIDASNPQRLFAAIEKGLFRSTDSGDSWIEVTQGLEGEDIDAVVVSHRGGQVFAGTFNGVFRSTDGGTTWAVLDHRLPNTDVRALAIEGGTPGRLYAGTAGGSVYSIELPPD